MAQQIGLTAILETSSWQKGVKTYLTSLDKMQKETSGFDGKMAAFGKKGIDSLQTLGKVALGASVAIAAAGAAAGVAIGKFVVSGISKAADLESQMSRIAATLNTTREAAQPLKDLIMQLALDPKLVVTTNEAADAIENLAKNGVSMKDILDGVARSVVLLANSTGAEFGAAADVVTDVMAQFNLTAQDTEHAVNQITGVTNLSKLTFDDYRLAIAQAGGAAGTLGVSFEDFNSVLIATNANFASGSDLGTSFKNFLTTLPGKSDKAKEAIAALGLEFFDAQGNMRSMAEISEELNQAFMNEVTFSTQVSNMTAEQTAQKKALEQQLARTGTQLFLYQAGVNGVGESEEANAESVAKLNTQYNAAMTAYEGLAGSMGTTVTTRRKLTEEEKIAYAQAIFGVDSMRLAFGMAEAGAVAYTDMATATKALGLEGKQLQVAQESLNQAFADGKITFFEFGTAQAAAIDASAQAAERMRNFKGVMDILKGAIEGLQIMIGDAFLPILTELAQMAVALVSAYGPNLIKPFQDFGAALGTFFASIKDGQAPFDAFTAAMGMFGAQGTAIAASMGSIALAVGGVVFAVGMVLQPITDAIGKFVEWQDVLIVLGGAIAMVVLPALYGIAAAMAPIILTIGGAILAVAGLRTAWENDWLGIQTKTTEAVSAIQIAFEPLTTAIREHGQGALVEIQAFATGTETEFTNLTAIWEGAKETASGMFSSIVGFATLNFPIWWGMLQAWGFAAGQWIVDAATAVSTHIATYTAALLTEIGTKLEEWKTKLTEWSAAAGEWLTTASAEVGTKLDEWYTALSSALGGKLASWMTAFDEWTTEAWNWLVTAAGLVSAQIDVWYTSLSTALSGKLATWKTAFVEWTTELSAWIAKSTTLVTTGIGTWYTSLSTAVNAKLPTFTTAMLKWATALVKWIGDTSANALPELGKWLGKILAWAPTGATLLATGMLKMATALVGWIGSTAADALPKLGTWLGKVTGWIIGTGVPALVVGVAELAKALVGWISGTGGVAVESSAQGQLDAEFEKFKTALSTAITNMWEGIKGFVQNFGQSFWDELGKNIDWLALGMTITSGIQSGVETVSGTLIIAFQTMAKNALDKITSVDWNAAGANVIRGVRDGMQSMVSTIISKVLSIVNEIVNGFKKAVDRVKQIGKDIISGLISGIAAMKDKLIAKITEMANAIPQWMKDILLIGSPSKVMAEIGKFIVEGLIAGLGRSEGDLLNSIGQMTGRFTQSIIRGGQDAIEAFSGIVGRLSNVAGGKMDKVDLLDWISIEGQELVPGGQQVVEQINAARKLWAFLQQQGDLISTIRDMGGDPSEILQGVKLGGDASPMELAQIVARMMESVNRQLERSIQAAANNFEGLIDKLREGRKTIEQVEAEFAAKRLSQLEQYKLDIQRLDENIAQAEQQLLASGGEASLATLKHLDARRAESIQKLREYITETNRLEDLLTGMQRRRQSISIEAIEAEFENLDQLGRYKQQVAMLEQQIASTEQQIMQEHNRDLIRILEDLDDRRTASLESIKEYLRQAKRLETALARMPTSTDARVQQAADTFRERLIDPLVASFDQLTVERRDTVLNEIDRLRGVFEQIRGEFAKNRLSPDELVEQMTASQTQLDRYKNAITQIDQQIANAHERLLSSGNTTILDSIKQMDEQRALSIETLKQFLTQSKQIETKLAQMPLFRGERAQAGADAFQERFIDPLVAAFDQQSVAQREVTLKQIDRYLQLLRDYSSRMQNAAAAEKHARLAIEGFGEGAQGRVENLLNTIYDVGTPTASRDNAIQSLRDFANALKAIRTELDARSGRRETTESIIERATGGFDQLSAYKTALADIDKRIASITDTIEETGNVAFLPQLRDLDAQRTLGQNELKNFLVQVSQLEGAFRDIKNLTGPGETSAQRFVDEQIQPILDAFSAPMRPQDRQAWLYAAQQRVAIVNKFIDQMRAVEKLQQRIATQEGFNHLADEFASMTDIAMPEAQRVALLNQLTLYITQMERLFALQKDIAVGVGADPLVERFKNERLDTIAKQLENINLSEAERLRLIEQYRMEQEKILAIQTKQNQLEFLQQQLSLLDKLKQLGTEEGFKVDVPNIIKGIGFGVNASLDDLLLLVGKVIDETVRFTNFKLGIKSPSKVFAEIGGYMMQGLAKGIESTMMRPINSLSGAISELPYALGGRSLTLNMGGVNISNGMDEVMFEARVRQILDRAFP